MTVRKAERLARELIALRLKFSDRDFQEAISLLSSGSFLELPIEAAREATKGPQSRANSKARSRQQDRSLGVELAIERLKDRAAGDETLQSFVRQFLNREILRSGPAVRAFAETLGLQLSRKLPSRIATAETLVKQLLKLPTSDRAPFVQQAGELDGGESSLQLWSDVIVKDRRA